jgi:transposase
MKKVGMDVGKKQSDCCVFDESGKIVERFQVRTRRTALSKVFANREKRLIGIESCRDAGWMYEHLTGLGHEVVVLDTTRSRSIGIGEGRRKSDRRDAEAIGRALVSGVAKPAHVLSRKRRALRDVLWGRDKLVATRTRFITMLRGQFQGRGQETPRCSAEKFADRLRSSGLPEVEDPAVQSMLRILDAVDAEVAVLDRHVAGLAKQEESFERLCSVPGVGPITALAFIAAVDNAERFPNAHAVEGYLGFGTSEYSTGGKRRTGRITKCGNPMGRRMLVMAAQNMLKGSSNDDDPLVVWARQVESRREKKRAVVGLARRLAGVLWAMTVDGTFYDPHGLARTSWQGMSRRARQAEAEARSMKAVYEAAAVPQATIR